MTSSGGYIANNFRQGYRAEYLANYIISEFGPCNRIHQENDYGIDLLATLMKKIGVGGIVSLAYGVQVKSGDATFNYKGDQLDNWLRTFNLPIILCRVERVKGRISLYSTWTLNDLLLKTPPEEIRQLDFIEGWGQEADLKMPEINGNNASVWVGDPIVSISTTDLSNTDLMNEIANLLAEWITMDSDNYSRRHAKIPILFGYFSWDTNKSLASSMRKWTKPYYFNDVYANNAMQLLQECAAIVAMNKGEHSDIYKDLGVFLKKYGFNMDDFIKKIFKLA
jgi:hypothetical protein